jgi:dihydrofolate reductase
MHVSAIAAMDRSGVIGAGGRMPWHLPADLKRFRKLTWGKPVIMGRGTFGSLAAPLPGRYNIVVTHQPDLTAPGCKVVNSVADALSAARDHLAGIGGDEAMIIGGGRLFEETLSLCDRLYLTLVEGRFQGDTYFPLEALDCVRWRMVACESAPADARNPYAQRFVILQRSVETSGPAQDFDLAAWLALPA